MGLFGGSSSRSKQTTITNTNTLGADNGSTVVQGGLTVNNGDAGSVIRETNAFLGETFSSALGLVEKQNQQFLEGVATGEIETKGDIIQKWTPIAFAVAVALIGWKVVK